MAGSEAILASGGGVDGAMGDWVLSIANGSPGRMVDALERGITEWGPMILPMLERAESGAFVVELGPALAELSERLAVADVARHANASKEQANRDAGRLLLHIIAERVRQLMRRGSADAARLERAAAAIDALHEAEHYLDRNVNAAFAMESAAIGLASAMSAAR